MNRTLAAAMMFALFALQLSFVSAAIIQEKQGGGTMCIQVYEPVCGTDGVTYGNSCFAGVAGATIDYQGECAAVALDSAYAFESFSATPSVGYAGENITFKARLSAGTPSPASVILKIDGAQYGYMSYAAPEYVLNASLESGMYSYSAMAVFDGNVIETPAAVIVVKERPLSNPSLKVGSETAWSLQGDFNSSEYVSGFEDKINSYLDSCVPDGEGYCSVPISVVSSNAGEVLLDSLAVYYVTTEALACEEKATGRKRCSSLGTALEEEWIDANCNYYWKPLQDCNALSTLPSESYVCSNNSLLSYLNRNEGYCDANALSCEARPVLALDSNTACLSTQTCDANQAKCVDRSAITSAAWSVSSFTAGSSAFMNVATTGISTGKSILFEVYLGGAYMKSLYAPVLVNAASARLDLNYSSAFSPGKTIMFIAYYTSDFSVYARSNSVPVACASFGKGTKRCSSDSLQEEWVNADCSTAWKDLDNCDALDSNSAPWLFSCAASTNTLVKTRSRIDGYCDASAPACKASTVTDTNTIRQCGTTETCDAASASCKANTCAPSTCPAGYADGNVVCANGVCTRTCSKLGDCSPSACPIGYADRNVSCLSTSCTRQCSGYSDCVPFPCPPGYSNGGISCSGPTCLRTCTRPASCGTSWALVANRNATGVATNASSVSKSTAAVSISGNYCYKAQYGSNYAWTRANGGRTTSVIYNYKLSDPYNAFSWTGTGKVSGSSGGYTPASRTALFSPKSVPCTGYNSCKVTNGSAKSLVSNAYLNINYKATNVRANAYLTVWRASFTAQASTSTSCARTATSSNQVCPRQNVYSNQSCEVGPYIPPETDPALPPESDGTGGPTGGPTIPPVTNPAPPNETGPTIPPVTPPDDEGTGRPAGSN